MAIRWGAAFILLAVVACGAPCHVTLTASEPKAACSVPPALLARSPRLVEVPVTKIENPSGQSFSIYLYLAAAKTEPEPIGNVTVFPSNQTGVFLMRCHQAFERVAASRVPVHVTIEIRPTLPAQPWRPISVSIGPLRWLTEEPK